MSRRAERMENRLKCILFCFRVASAANLTELYRYLNIYLAVFIHDLYCLITKESEHLL